MVASKNLESTPRQSPGGQDNGIPSKRVRGRPPGHNRTPISRAEQRQRNAMYEKERRRVEASWASKLATEMRFKGPVKKLVAAATPFIKCLENEVMKKREEAQRLQARNAELKKRYARLKAFQADRIKADRVEAEWMKADRVEANRVNADIEEEQVLIDGEFEVPKINDASNDTEDGEDFPDMQDVELPLLNEEDQAYLASWSMAESIGFEDLALDDFVLGQNLLIDGI